MNFRKYQHLERLGTTEVEDILAGQCVIFPKLDGTNASVWVNSEGLLMAGSRNRQLTLENDNAGFYAWVCENEDYFYPFFKNYPTCTLYGEWLVPHSLKTYREDAWRKFYVFDVVNDLGRHLTYSEYKPMLDFHGIEYLAPLGILNNGSEEQVYKFLEKNTFLIEDGQGVGEGIVIKNYDFQNKFGRTTWAKLVTSAFKEKHHKEMGAPMIGGDTVEEKIVETFVTQALVDKVHAKISVEEGGWSSKWIARLLNTVYYDLITEETWEILKKYKDPKINFKFLRRLVTQKVKELREDLF